MSTPDVMENRKIIQMMPYVVPGMNNMSTPDVGIVVLCDDGTMWGNGIGGYGAWQQIHGPEHLEPMHSSYSLREDLKEILDKKTHEKVTKLFRSGGVRL